MPPSLVRWKFVDRTWTADDFDALGAFWLAAYEEADHPPHGDWRSEQILEIRLFGFPRSAAAVVGDELARRLSEARVPVEVTTPDPDTLVAKTKPRAGDRAPFAGFGVSALTGPLFDGMVIELRYTVVDAGATEQGRGLCGSTLVVVGELRGGVVVVKAVWADPAFMRVLEHWDAPGWEDHILTAFDRYRSHDRVIRPLAKSMFNRLLRRPPRGAEAAFQRCWRWLTVVTSDGPRTGGLLLRCGIFVALATVVVALLALMAHFKYVGLGVPPLAIGLVTIWLAIDFIKRENWLLFDCYRNNRESYRAYFRVTARYESVPADTPAPWRDDPTLRKLTAEMTEAGFAVFADVTTIPTESAGVVHRVFCAPDGVSYLVLSFNFANGYGTERSHVWPARRYSTLFQTFSETGLRFETLDEPPTLTVLRRADPTGRVLVVPKGASLADAYRAHTKAVAEWLTEENTRAERHEPAGALIARQEEISVQQRAIYRAKPYSWSDHVRWYLQLDAKPAAKSD